jgi:hypothetical protein
MDSERFSHVPHAHCSTVEKRGAQEERPELKNLLYVHYQMLDVLALPHPGHNELDV